MMLNKINVVIIFLLMTNLCNAEQRIIDKYLLNFPYVHQKYTLTCWAACCTMIKNYYPNSSTTQEKILKWATNNASDQNTMNYLTRALIPVGVNWTYKTCDEILLNINTTEVGGISLSSTLVKSSLLPFDYKESTSSETVVSLENEINHDRPFIITWHDYNSSNANIGNGHAVVCDGYKYTPDNMYPKKDHPKEYLQVFYADPGRTNGWWAESYSNVVSVASTANSGATSKWDATLLINRLYLSDTISVVAGYPPLVSRGTTEKWAKYVVKFPTVHGHNIEKWSWDFSFIDNSDDIYTPISTTEQSGQTKPYKAYAYKQDYHNENRVAGIYYDPNESGWNIPNISVPTSNTLVPLPSANSTWREDEVFDAKTQIHTYSSKRCRITIRGIDEEDKIHTSIIFVHYNDNLSVGCDNLNFTNIVKQLKK